MKTVFVKKKLMILFICVVILSSCGIFKKHNWSKIERDAFMNACVEGLKDVTQFDGKKYCSCMLEKIEKIAKTAVEAQSITETQMKEMAGDCLEGK